MECLDYRRTENQDMIREQLKEEYKTAALEQKNAIQRLQENGRLERLPEKLRQTALLRLQYPEMSLSQLAEKCDPPVTKSCMNHRMRKLMEEAKEL